MLFGNIGTPGIVDGKETLSHVLHFLRDNAANLRDGRHDLRDGIFVVAKCCEPGEASAKRFETHVKYADVQYVVSGGENILVAPLDGLATVEDRLEADDVRFHAEPAEADVATYTLRAGDFLLLLPEDAHKPECTCGIAVCRKCIAKIPMELLL